jgi:hypothetical protein
MHFCTSFLTRGLKDFKGQNLSPQVFDRSQILKSFFELVNRFLGFLHVVLLRPFIFSIFRPKKTP